MKLKDDILEKFEKGVTIFEIAEEYNTDINAVLKLLDLTRLDSNGVLTQDSEGNMEVHLNPTDDAKLQKHLKQYGLSREDFLYEL
jgi:hypothetical protein|tara:strand:+ start:291 stop:545 length:255 start_codon:yes stop_codon:yes gene_type:complete